jgi:hypothetical protein
MTTVIDAAGDLYRQAVPRFRAGDHQGARDLLARAVEADPAHSGARFALAMCLLRTGDPAAAEHQLRDLLQHDPGNRLAARELDRMRRDATDRPLTDLLDESADDDVTGPSVFHGRRPLGTHRRLWLGVVLATGGLAQILLGAPPPPAEVASAWADVPDPWWTTGGFALVVAGIALMAGAAINAAVTRYVMYTRCVEVTSGVILRSRRLVWLYDLIDVRFQQDPVLQVLGTARIVLVSEKTHQTQPAPGVDGLIARLWARQPTLVGLADADAMRALQEDLFRRSLRQRRAAKKTFM